MNHVQTPSLRLERSFQASAEEVFDAWTNPEVLRRWWVIGPDWRTHEADVDLRVGGEYRLSMEHAEDGTRHTVVGEYREVERPERLVYTWSWESGAAAQAEQDPDGQANVSLVTVRFLEEAKETTVILEHTLLATPESARRHEAGWRGCLESLHAGLVWAPRST